MEGRGKVSFWSLVKTEKFEGKEHLENPLSPLYIIGSHNTIDQEPVMDPPDHSHNQNTPMGFGGSGEELTYGSSGQHAHHQLQQSRHAQQLDHRREQEREVLRQQLQAYWENQRQEIERVNDFKSPSIPWARIKKIMKADEDVRMISAEAVVLFAKACEMFTSELTLCAWSHTVGDKRTSIQKTDVAAALAGNEIFDFLHGIVPKEVRQLKDEAAASVLGGAMLVPPRPPRSSPYRYVPMPPQYAPRVGRTSGVIIGNLAKDRGGTSMPVPGPSGSVPYGYMPPQHAPQVGIAGVIMGDPAMDPNLHAQQQPLPYNMEAHAGTAGVMMGDPAMDPNLHAQQQPLPYNMETHVGTAGVMMGNPAMDPNLYAQQPYHYMAPQGGTAGVITGDPAMDPNLYAQQPDPYVTPSQMLQQQPPEQQEAQLMWPLQQLGQQEERQMWPQQQLEQQQAPQMWSQKPPEQQEAPQMWSQQPPQMWPQQPPEQQPPPDH